MDQFNYLREKRRMLDSLGREKAHCDGVKCAECPLSQWKNGQDKMCTHLEMEHPDEATEIVRKWANEHPAQTRLDYLKSVFPLINNLNLQDNCWELVSGQSVACGNDCEACWNQPFEGWDEKGGLK